MSIYVRVSRENGGAGVSDPFYIDALGYMFLGCVVSVILSHFFGYMKRITKALELLAARGGKP